MSSVENMRAGRHMFSYQNTEATKVVFPCHLPL